MKLRLLKGFELSHDGVVVNLPHSAERVIALLAIHSGRLLRGYVAGVLWLDHSQDAANASLRTALWRLRRPELPLVVATGSHLALAEGIRVDLHAVGATTSQILNEGTECGPADLDELMGAGELLPDWYDDWVAIERERFRQQRLHALEATCLTLTAQGRYALAVEAGLAAVSEEPLRESTHRAVMRAHLAEGNRWEALRQYEMCRRMLQQQIGLTPSSETERLRERCGRPTEGLRTALLGQPT